MVYINILLIAAVWVFLLDLSGAWNEITSMVAGWLTSGKVKKPFQLKPFSCSLCMTFWTGLVYLLCVGQLTLPNVAYVCLVAFMTPRIKDVLQVVDAAVAKLFDLIITKL